MKKSDLKTGMCLTLHNAERYLVLCNCETRDYGHQKLVFVKNNSFDVGENYNEDLTHVDDRKLDIMKVAYAGYVSHIVFSPDNPALKVIWRRKNACDHVKDTKASLCCPYCGEELSHLKIGKE